MADGMPTLVRVVQRFAEQRGDRPAFEFSFDGETIQRRLTYGELDAKACALATALGERGATGQRVLIVCQASDEFIIGLFGCLYAGAIAVPVHPPTHKRALRRLETIIADADAAFALGDAESITDARARLDRLPSARQLAWLVPSSPDGGVSRPLPDIEPDTAAIIQYTSGSTTTPKGVVLDHRNMVSNLEAIRHTSGGNEDDVGVFWLPLQHDMGLIGAVLGTIYLGAYTLLLTPSSFIERPMRWLEWISRKRATTSVAPNFAYELCVARSTPDERDALDLSGWSTAMCGAEPVRLSTLERFADAFEPAGFRRDALRPVYGLAEATLLVSGGSGADRPVVCYADGVALGEGRVRPAVADSATAVPFVGCGRAHNDTEIVIANAETCRECAPDEIGEIWVSGDTVARGYWRKPAELEETFGAYLPGTGRGPYLRTGDLGFLLDGELFIAGRLKDLIVIRGRNHYPDDIEATVQDCHPSLLPGRGAALGITPASSTGEELVVVQEVGRRLLQETDPSTVIDAVRATVAEHYGVRLHAVVLVKAFTLPTTSSGKIERQSCRRAFLDGKLRAVTEWHATPAVESSVAGPPLSPIASADTLCGMDREQRQARLTAYLRHETARRLGMDPEQLDIRQPLSAFGIDSLTATELRAQLHRDLGVMVPTVRLLEGPTVTDLAVWVSNELARDRATTAGDGGGTGPTTNSADETEHAAAVAPAHSLSYGQQAMWFLHELAPLSPAYNIRYVGRVQGELDDVAFERAAQALVDRHPMLRTTYATRDAAPIQLVHSGRAVSLTRHDATDWDEERLDQWLRREGDRPFDLRTGPVLRLSLLKRGPREHVLLLAAHHIAIDFWSLDLLLDELRLLYAAQHGGSPLSPVTGEYVEHACWQARLLDGEDGERLHRYWSEQLADAPSSLHLPTDRPRPPVQTYEGAVHHFQLSTDLTARVRALAMTSGATPYTALLTAYAVLLHRYSDQDDLVIGSPMAARERPGINEVVGYFANPAPVRVSLRGDPTFATLLGQVRATVHGALEHQEYPFPVLIERLKPDRDPSRNPLFQVAFVWEQPRRFQDRTAAEGAALPLETIALGQGGAPLDLMLLMSERDGALAGAFQYNTDLFDAATVARMAGHIDTLLAGAVADLDSPVSALPLLTTGEREQQEGWNATRVDYCAPRLLHELVETQVRRSLDAVAVRFRGQEMTYAELDRRAGSLAWGLVRRGAGPGTVVPVFVTRSPDLVVALLGVLKTGAAFLPLDPSQSATRLAAMLADAPGAPVCVTEWTLLDRLPPFNGETVCVDADDSLDGESIESVSKPAGSDVAYVIHTSGSTGRPKGAMNTHAGIRNRLLWMQDTFGLTPDDPVLFKTPVSFDVFVWEVFWPLIAGSRVVIAEPDGHTDMAYLVRTIRDERITTTHFVPSLLREFLATPGVAGCSTLRRVMCSGEVLPYELTEWFQSCLDAELHNLYGPAEAAIDVTHFDCRRGAEAPPVPIGRPIANTQIHLLDDHRQRVPVGVPGEIYIGGVGVARGYLNRPDLTAESFIPDPFRDEPGARLYRTGDIARYRDDGVLKYLGRRDDQVKISGVRVEPQEVEAALGGHPGVRECAVIAHTAHRGTILIAYVVPSGDAVPSRSELRAFLLERLPTSMVPAGFTIVAALPHTPNGKLNRRALANADRAEPYTAAPWSPPRTHTERVLADIWREVLRIGRVSVHDDFFSLGGTSTHSVELANRAGQAGLAITPKSVFRHSTVAELAAACGTAETNRTVAEVTRPEAGASREPVSREQRRNTVIESIGVYLPEKIVTTAEVIAGCVNDIGLPLEQLTGIRSRRVAGNGEYSIDLARRAVTNCLARSRYRADEIDVVIACNISRCDGPGHRFTFEPGTAARLREQCGLSNALSFDVTNACAGMFTGVLIADAYLKTGAAQRVLVASGEYVTHLTETAQREIDGFLDPRLACLTVGDAGAALILEQGPNGDVGFHEIDMCTLSRYSALCVAKATDRPHGGAIMLTDSIKQTAVAVRRAVPYTTLLMQRHGWEPERFDHLIMHQTSQASMNDAVAAISQAFGRPVAHSGNTINNLADRGNTASTTHVVAVNDHIAGGRIRSGDKVLFSITGSGQTVGAALYTFDDLPDRLRNGSGVRRRSADRACAVLRSRVPRARVAAVGTATVEIVPDRSSTRLAVAAASACLDRVALDRGELDIIVHAGIYRDDFLSEPAIAALVAGDLKINDDVQSPDGPKTLAFDVLNGSVGFLNACDIAAQMLAAGKGRNAMVVAAEVENNPPGLGRPPRGVHEAGSAVILTASDTETAGFGRFVFEYDEAHSGAIEAYTTHSDGRTWLQVDADPNLADHYLKCVPGAVADLLAAEGLDPAQIDVVLPPQVSPEFITDLSDRIGVPRERFVDIAVPGADYFTSSVPFGLQHAEHHGLLRPGRVGLLIAVGSGVQVGCATYYF